MDSIIQTRNLNLYYGSFQALKNINMDIPPNTICALIGPSGCGKSTFLRIFNRMNDFIDDVSITGDALIEGVDIYKTKSVNIISLRKKVGMVFQKPTPFPKTIFENVVYGLRVNGVKKKSILVEEAEKALTKAFLWDEVKDILHRSALSLSGGQQQRLCIARTLAIEPAIILMDEPTSALDPIATAKIEELIYELKNSYTIVIVTHNLQQAGRVSDYTAFFYLGELIEFNKTNELFTNPRQEKTNNYITGRFG